MRAAKSPPFLMLYFILAMGMPFFFQGCGSTAKITYKTLEAVGMAENKAMQAAAQARHLGKLTEEQYAKASDVHAKFNTAYNTACDLASFDKTQPVPPQVASIVAELITLLNQFGVELKL